MAAEIARNAADDDLVQLVESDQTCRPVCTAALLLRELAVLATERGEESIAEQARSTLACLFDELDWSKDQVWEGSEIYGAKMFTWFAAASSSERVRTALAAALRDVPRLAPVMLLSCANWEERRDSARMHEPGVATRTVDEVPTWLPAAELLSTLRSSDADPDDDEELSRLVNELSERLR